MCTTGTPPGFETNMTRPTLHCGFQHVPLVDGQRGRFPGGVDAEFVGTRMLDNYWPTHSFAGLFMPAVLDRLKHPSLVDLAEVGRLIETHAGVILDNYVRRFGEGPKPSDGVLRVFIDLEAVLLGGREPYVDVVYGERCVRVMKWLCNRVEHVARTRGWRVKAAPYRPLRQTGLVHARESWISREMPSDFVLKWGAAAVGELLDMDTVWCHVYCPQDPALMMGATHADYAYRQVLWTAQQVAAAGGAPDEVWMALWLEDELRPESMQAIFRGIRRGLEHVRDRGLGVLGAADPHVVVSGGWKLLRAAYGPDVTEAKQRPLELLLGDKAMGPVDAAKTLAELWNAGVVEPFEGVFGPLRGGAVAVGNGAEQDQGLESDVHEEAFGIRD